MKKQSIYGAYALLLGLVIAACFLPQVVLNIQDSYRMESTFTETRTGINIENLNISYEMDITKRLTTFANAETAYFVTGTEYDKNDGRAMVEEVLYQDFLITMIELGILPNSFYKSYEIEDLKKYVIYNNELNNGVAIIAWYCRLSYEEGIDLEFLADDKTDTIYYIRYTDRSMEETELYPYSKVIPAKRVFTDGYELRYFIGEYYGLKYMDGYFDGAGSSEISAASEGVTPLFSIEENWEQLSYNIILPYDNASLDFLFSVTENEKQFANVVFGIRQIGDLIPEFAEN